MATPAGLWDISTTPLAAFGGEPNAGPFITYLYGVLKN
jgi:hypothetical protein